MTNRSPSQLPSAGLVQSLLVRAQRATLDAIGREVGATVVYMKSAWADPVLYGGRGERVGCDLDALVERAVFDRFAAALVRRGYEPIVSPSHRASIRWGEKAWPFRGPRAHLTVDLHRGLCLPGWFAVPVDAFIRRSIEYPVPAGAVRSFCPEDQVLYAVLHHADSQFVIDGRHLEDIVRLARSRPIDWDTVLARGHEYGMTVPLALLLGALRAKGVEAPDGLAQASWSARARHKLSTRWVETSPELHRNDAPDTARDLLVRMPILSDRVTALPRFLAHYAALRALDRVHRVVPLF